MRRPDNELLHHITHDDEYANVYMWKYMLCVILYQERRLFWIINGCVHLQIDYYLRQKSKLPCDRIPAKLVTREPCQSKRRLCSLRNGLYRLFSPSRITLKTWKMLVRRHFLWNKMLVAMMSCDIHTKQYRVYNTLRLRNLAIVT